MTLVKQLIAIREAEQLPRYITQRICLKLENVEDHVEKRYETEPATKRSRVRCCRRKLGKKLTKKNVVTKIMSIS